jgi:hypothetical protein
VHLAKQRQHRRRIDATLGRITAGEKIDVVRFVRQRADLLRRFGDLRGRQIGGAERAERARIRGRGHKLRRREAAAHRGLDDRVLNAEPTQKVRHVFSLPIQLRTGEASRKMLYCEPSHQF